MEDKPTLLLMAGLPGVGKTTLALALGRILHWPVLDKDTLKSTLLLAGISEHQSARTAYDLLFALGHDLLVQQGHSIILDCPTLYTFIVEHAAEMALMAGARLKVVLCLVESNIRNQRLTGRSARISQITGDLVATEEEDQRRFLHLPPDTLVLHTIKPLEELVEVALVFLAQDI